MKAKEYYEKYKGELESEDVQEFQKGIKALYVEMLQECEKMIEARHIKLGSSCVSLLREFNQKANAIARMSSPQILIDGWFKTVLISKCQNSEAKAICEQI